jgi:hypothetical protein
LISCVSYKRRNSPPSSPPPIPGTDFGLDKTLEHY